MEDKRYDCLLEAGLDLFHLHTQIGRLLVGLAGGKVWICDWDDGSDARQSVWKRVADAVRLSASREPDRYGDRERDNVELAARVSDAVHDYLHGETDSLDLPIQLAGTDFQIRVWIQLAGIPYGERRTYKEIARKIGRPGASRAVGTACKANALSLILPCHRVVPSQNGIGTYAGGKEAKEYLLTMERKHQSRFD